MINKDCSKIGFLAKPHGVAGKLILRLNGYFAEEIEPKEPLFVDYDNTLVPFFIEEIIPQGERAIVKLEFVNTTEKALVLAKKDVYASLEVKSFNVDNAVLFENYTIIDSNSRKTAKILEYFPDELNPLYKILYEDNELLIPVSPDFILKIDKRKKILHMNLPEGLLDL